MGYFRKDEDVVAKAEKIIRNHVAWSMGAGLIPIVVVDIFAVSAVQLDMVKQLANNFDVDFRETEGKALITSLVGSSFARMMAGGAAKLIPGFGTVVGGATMSALSGASTYALGEAFKEHFITGGTFLDFDVDRLRKYYSEKFEKGKDVAEEIKQQEKENKDDKASAQKREAQRKEADRIATERKLAQRKEADRLATERKLAAERLANAAAEKAEGQSNLDTTLAKLKELAKMRDAGIITEADFQSMKKKLVEEF